MAEAPYYEQLREIREAMRITSRVLAEKAQVTHQTVLNIEAGKGCGIKTLRKVAQALGLDVAISIVPKDQ